MSFRAVQKIRSFGTMLIIMGSVLMFLSIIGLPLLAAVVLANNMSEYMKHIPTSTTTIFLNILPFYLIGTIVVSIYFIIAGVKLSTNKYTLQQLRGVLARVIFGSIFWPIVGLITMIIAIIARQDWLKEYEFPNSQEITKNQDEIFSLSPQTRLDSPSSIFPKIKVFGVLMAVLNILADIAMVMSIMVAMIATNSNNASDIQLIILNNLPGVIIDIIMLLTHIYVAYLGFSLKKYENDFKKLKIQLIIIAVVSVLSELWLLAIIGDIICFSSLLPQYERELKNRSNSPMKPAAE